MIGFHIEITREGRAAILRPEVPNGLAVIPLPQTVRWGRDEDGPAVLGAVAFEMYSEINNAVARVLKPVPAQLEAAEVGGPVPVPPAPAVG